MKIMMIIYMMLMICNVSGDYNDDIIMMLVEIKIIICDICGDYNDDR